LLLRKRGSGWLQQVHTFPALQASGGVSLVKSSLNFKSSVKPQPPSLASQHSIVRSSFRNYSLEQLQLVVKFQQDHKRVQGSSGGDSSSSSGLLDLQQEAKDTLVRSALVWRGEEIALG
jgi:hypothetical protein